MPAPEPITVAREIGSDLGHMLHVYFFSWGVRKRMILPKEVRVLLARKGDTHAERMQNNPCPLHQYPKV